MKKGKWLILAALVIVLAAGYFCNPFLRVKTFVFLHSAKIQTAMASGSGIPANIGFQSVNTWPGEHGMTEFILFRHGLVPSGSYYGCYYSPEDVPLAFQNAQVPLIQNGHAYWEWQGEGDNHGATQKLKDHWYYFEAFF